MGWMTIPRMWPPSPTRLKWNARMVTASRPLGYDRQTTGNLMERVLRAAMGAGGIPLI